MRDKRFVTVGMASFLLLFAVLADLAGGAGNVDPVLSAQAAAVQSQLPCCHHCNGTAGQKFTTPHAAADRVGGFEIAVGVLLASLQSIMPKREIFFIRI